MSNRGKNGSSEGCIIGFDSTGSRNRPCPSIGSMAPIGIPRSGPALSHALNASACCAWRHCAAYLFRLVQGQPSCKTAAIARGNAARSRDSTIPPLRSYAYLPIPFRDVCCSSNTYSFCNFEGCDGTGQRLDPFYKTNVTSYNTRRFWPAFLLAYL